MSIYIAKVAQHAGLLISCYSGTSIDANLEEAEAGQSRNDFISKCAIALKEARETHYWLRLLSATGQINPDQLTVLIKEANEIIAILTTIVRKARGDRKALWSFSQFCILNSQFHHEQTR